VILLIKFLNESPTIFDTSVDNGIPQPIDGLLVNEVLNSNFPIFQFDTDRPGAVADRKAGTFSLSFSFKQDTVSYYGDNINEFFRGGTRSYKYWVGIQRGSTIFHGTFESSNVDSDFTITEGRYDVTLVARDTLEEFAKYLQTLHSLFNITETMNLSFEQYMNDYHLKGLNVNYNGTLSGKIGLTTYLKGYAYYNGIKAATNLQGVSRLETFNELARGLGFIYYLSVNTNLEELYENPSDWYPRSFMDVNVNWLRTGDSVYSTDMTITASQIHRERTLPRSTRYLFIGYRNIISTAFPDVDEVDFTAVRGILTDGDNLLESDSIDNVNPIYAHYPFFYFAYHTGGNAPDGNAIMDDQFAYYDRRYPYPEKPLIINNSDVSRVELRLYNYNTLGGATVPGSCAYARLFTTDSGFAPIQRFVVTQYERYILGLGKKIKEVNIPIENDVEILPYKIVRLIDDQGEGVYYISKISELDYSKRTVSLELTQI
jgi:hypothetical protein